MSDRVVPLRPPERPPRLDELVNQIRVMAEQGADTTRVHFGHTHFRDQLAARKVNMRQVLETLRDGSPVGRIPTLDRYGNWRVKLGRVASGRRVQVVAVKQDHIIAGNGELT